MDRRIKGIIDVHSHSMLSSWRNLLKKKSGSGQPLFEGCAIPDWDPETAIDVMDQHNIAAMVLSNPVGTKDLMRDEAVPLARDMNEELAEILKRYPKRFGAFAVLPLQDIEASLVELEYALDKLGFDGVCMQTSFEGVYPGHSRFEPLFAELNRRKATVFVHPASPIYSGQVDMPLITGVLEYPFDTTRAVASFVLSGMRMRYPDVNYIATHGGGALPFLAHRIAFVTGRRGTGYHAKLTYEETMSGFKSIHYDLAIATAPEQLAALRQLVPVDQLLVGFDYPMVAATGIRPAIEMLEMSEEFDDVEATLIASKNALRLFPSLAEKLGESALETSR
ncbi:amidohydrolase family protein [Rhodoblastus sp.]|uniref:amidohydrolase family protein n=1 Tax=Rhodoblastus sp. TaxID=1962975 RepID=UPI0035B1FC85